MHGILVDHQDASDPIIWMRASNVPTPLRLFFLFVSNLLFVMTLLRFFGPYQSANHVFHSITTSRIVQPTCSYIRSPACECDLLSVQRLKVAQWTWLGCANIRHIRSIKQNHLLLVRHTAGDMMCASYRYLRFDTHPLSPDTPPASTLRTP